MQKQKRVEVRVRRHRDGAALLRPVHGAQVELGAGPEFLYALPRDLEHRLDAHRRLEAHGLGRAIKPRAMLVEIGRDPLEGARAVEHARTQPEGVGARPDDGMVALEPFAVEKGEGLRPGGHRLLDPRNWENRRAKGSAPVYRLPAPGGIDCAALESRLRRAVSTARLGLVVILPAHPNVLSSL